MTEMKEKKRENRIRPKADPDYGIIRGRLKNNYAEYVQRYEKTMRTLEKNMKLKKEKGSCKIKQKKYIITGIRTSVMNLPEDET